MSSIKVHYPIRRRADLSVPEFAHYWITTHAEIAKRFELIAGMTQCVAQPVQPACLGAPLGELWCDGVAELWADDERDLDALAADPSFAGLIADEDNFVEPGRRFFIKTKERVLCEDGFDRWRRGVKVAIFARRPPGVGRAEFQAAWADPGATDAGRRLGATRQVECAVIDPREGAAGSGEAPYDAVRELWWPSVGALEEAALADRSTWSRLVSPDAIDAGRSFAICSHERVVLPPWERGPR